jgi:putative DNA primase/helicase
MRSTIPPSRQTPLNAALRYLEAGLSIIPIARDGSKSPTVAWKQYQTERPSPEELQAWFSRSVGIGILGGKVSENLGIIDLDAPEIFTPWCEMVEELAPGLVQRLPVVKTPSEGRHCYYRCEIIEGNQKLARRPDANGRPQVLVETRGQGGYVIAPRHPGLSSAQKNL